MIDTILGGVVIAVISGVVGKTIGEKHTIKESVCSQFRDSCQKLLVEKIDNVGEKIDALTSVVNNKLLGH